MGAVNVSRSPPPALIQLCTQRRTLRFTPRHTQRFTLRLSIYPVLNLVNIACSC